MRERLSGWGSRLLIIPLAGIIFGGALGAGFQWGAPESTESIRVYETAQRDRVGGDGSPAGDIAGFVTSRDGDAWIVRDGDESMPIRFAQGAIVEAMLPIWTDAVSPGDWIVIGGTDDNVNSFITTGIVIIPNGQALTGDDVIASIEQGADR